MAVLAGGAVETVPLKILSMHKIYLRSHIEPTELEFGGQVQESAIPTSFQEYPDAGGLGNWLRQTLCQNFEG